jgi:hypothetical protein
MNKVCRVESKSKEKNIYARADGMFIVKKMVNGKRLYLGIYDNLEDAIAARDA